MAGPINITNRPIASTDGEELPAAGDITSLDPGDLGPDYLGLVVQGEEGLLNLTASPLEIAPGVILPPFPNITGLTPAQINGSFAGLVWQDGPIIVPPTVATSPSLTGGVPMVGVALEAAPGTYLGDEPITVSRQWQRRLGAGAWSPVSGETTLTYTPVAGDVAYSLRLVETASNAGGSVVANSAPSAAVVPVSLQISGTPSGGAEGASYSFIPVITGGQPPYSAAWTGDDLEDFGLTLDPVTGALSSAELLQGGTLTGTITVTDDDEETAALPIEITVADVGDLANLVLPAFLQPDGSGGWEPAEAIDSNANVFLDAGEWAGGTPPYAYEFAIYDASDDSVIVARGSEDEVDLGSMAGLTIYGRVWCIDSAGAEAFADTAAFGPVLAGFVPEMLASLNFRSTAPEGASVPVQPATYFLPTDAYTGAAIRGEQVFGVSAPMPSAGDRTSSTDARLRGFHSFTSSNPRERVDLKGGYTGKVRIKLAAGLTNAASAGNRLALYDGNPDEGGALITAIGAAGPTPGELSGGYAIGEVLDATGAAKALATWSAEGGGTAVEWTMVHSFITIRRAVGGSASAGHINHLYVESAQ